MPRNEELEKIINQILNKLFDKKSNNEKRGFDCVEIPFKNYKLIFIDKEDYIQVILFDLVNNEFRTRRYVVL